MLQKINTASKGLEILSARLICMAKPKDGDYEMFFSTTRIMIYKVMFYKSKYSILVKNKRNLKAFRVLDSSD